MKLFTKTMASALTAAALITAPSFLRAAYCPSDESCYDPCAEMQFSFGADFLWLKPCVSNLDVAADLFVDDNFTEVDYHHLKTDWEPGVRVYFGMPDFYCDWNVKGSWTYFKAHDTPSYSGDTLLQPLIHPFLVSQAGGAEFNFIDVSWTLEYHEFDFVFSMPFEFCCNHYLEPFFGVNGLLLRHRLETDNFNDAPSEGRGDGFTEWHSNSWGVGLIMGTQYELWIDDGFKFHSKASASLLAGRSTKGSNIQELDNGIIGEDFENFPMDIFDDKKDCDFFPGLYIQTGLSYENEMCGMDYGVHIGYEFKQWWNLPSPRHFGSSSDDLQASSDGSTRFNLGVHGLYLGMDVKF